MSCLEPHKTKEPKFKFKPWWYLWNEIHTFCWAIPNCERTVVSGTRRLHLCDKRNQLQYGNEYSSMLKKGSARSDAHIWWKLGSISSTKKMSTDHHNSEIWKLPQMWGSDLSLYPNPCWLLAGSWGGRWSSSGWNGGPLQLKDMKPWHWLSG